MTSLREPKTAIGVDVPTKGLLIIFKKLVNTSLLLFREKINNDMGYFASL